MSDIYILQTHELVKDFKGFVAVNGVNLNVKRGQIHALIGPNGAGKTTVFNMLTKFLIPTRGQIVFKGQDITTEKPSEVARRGIVRSFQISATFPNLTVMENVRVGLQRSTGMSMHFWRSERSLNKLNDQAMHLLDQVDLDRVTQLIKKVSANRTILMVEHNMNVVSKIAETISVLQRGQVIAEGSYSEVSQNPQVLEAYMGTTDNQLEGAHG